ncbi:fam-b protein [Plasmodium yoelii]|uniref:Fam-b protein n=3 Tax=Plasmodium yoelii TaxID=5861 RepID=A0AAF0B2Z1_PLAYO|nr:fam-b protein [Plasmodium yoelii]WBY60492.1 fam-b protein [Plasmodium yoelii yoelii]VTZ81099.1 fam-b protein [Plasmodium yoelii]|eukprot:XP_022813790.1 fam-b protein [Plasmodium yoelii]
MKVSILKFVFFSIIICFFEYAQNELYYINERNICFEMNVTNFRNNRILADGDNQFNLYEFYESTSSVENQFNDNDNDDEKTISIRNTIDLHVKKDKKSKKLLYLKNVNKKRKKLIHEHHKEIEETEKEIDNINNNKLAIEPIENNYVSEEDFKQLENEGNIVVSEDYENDSSIEDELNNKLELNKMFNGLMKRVMLLNMLFFVLSINEWVEIVFIIMSVALSFEIFFRFYQYVKLYFKVYKTSLKKKKSR